MNFSTGRMLRKLPGNGRSGNVQQEPQRQQTATIATATEVARSTEIKMEFCGCFDCDKLLQKNKFTRTCAPKTHLETSKCNGGFLNAHACLILTFNEKEPRSHEMSTPMGRVTLQISSDAKHNETTVIRRGLENYPRSLYPRNLYVAIGDSSTLLLLVVIFQHPYIGNFTSEFPLNSFQRVPGWAGWAGSVMRFRSFKKELEKV